jgi:hypothetical protein
MIWTLLYVFALALATIPGYVYLRDRARRKERNIFSSWPIRRVHVQELDPVFRPSALGPTADTEAQLIAGASLYTIVGGTTDAEAWILAVLSKRARLMFEFGTATGRTTYIWARNSPPEARIVTITLRPDDIGEYRNEPGDAKADARNALSESRFSSLYYSGTPVEAKVTQLYGDSKRLDETPWVGQCDLVFVDGSHAHSYVESDTAKALRLIRAGGLVLWHDYRGAKVPGVYRVLNDLSRRLPLIHIAGTSMVAYRAP